MYLVFYNPTAGNGKCKEKFKEINGMINGDASFYNVLENPNYKVLLTSLNENDSVIVCGGDGTLNHFVNDIEDFVLPCPVFYYPSGTGNDFVRDIGFENETGLIDITKYIYNLPIVTVNGVSKKFLNGIGYGIDGYCCEEGDKLRNKSDKPINYTKIAIKGLLFDYHPTNAVVEVDGNTFNFKKVWLAPTMFGRFFGGGMMCAPHQNRQNEEHHVSVCPMFGLGKIKALMIFPKIFEGKHVEHTEYVKEITGHKIHISFDRPTALQIDGETITEVNEYFVES